MRGKSGLWKIRSGVLGAAAALIALSCASAASALTPGDLVVYRVGTGASALSSAATPVFLDEYEASGKLVETLALPTAASGSNKPLFASGSASSEGLLTLSGDDNWLLLGGYDTTAGTAKVAETKSTAVPRTIARIGASGEIDTTTALTDAASENNIRSATSSNGTNIWVGGAAGGVRFATLGASTSTSLNEADKNVRMVSIAGGQLYASADPTKAGALTIAAVGSGLPTTAGQTIANLPFATAPKQPYAYSFVTLGIGTAPDTVYVADNEAGQIVKYGLLEGSWVKQGSVAVAGVTGVTADDTAGVVSIFATAPGALSEITDSSGLGGTLSGTASTIATAATNEAFRGVAFAPGTVFGTGSPPPPPKPTIAPADSSLAAAIGDPTNATLPLKVADTAFEPGELTVTATASNTSVASAVSVAGSGSERVLSVTPGAVGTSTIALTVEAPDATKSTTTIEYGVSAEQQPADRYYAGAGNASSAIDVGDGYMILADDENNILRLYHERASGTPVKTFDFTKQLPDGTVEIDMESSARSGDTLYWMGSLSNKKSGKLAPERDIVFAATIAGSGASTELAYLGSYTHLREDMVAWDEANGNPLGLAGSTASGLPSNEADGFNAEGLEFAKGSSTTAYVGLRAPQEPPNARSKALLVPVTNFASLVGGAGKATFGSPLEWDLGGRGVREIRDNAAGEYLVIAGTPDDSNSSFGLYAWDGDPADQPVLTETPISGVADGAWEDVVSVPRPLAQGASVELLEDNGESAWYGNGLTSKDGLASGLQKDIGRVFQIELPAPSAPGAPALSAGSSPNDTGRFTLAWTPSSSVTAPTYTLEHESANSGWSAVASGLTAPEYTFAAGDPEGEGTWSYRVIESDEGAASEPSAASAPVVVDESAPLAPTAAADRAPDYAGGGGWYRDTVTVSFASNGDPALADGSAGSGVDPASLPTAETFAADGAHEAAGAVADVAGNVSTAATLLVQVDASPPTVHVGCPASAPLGAKGVTATVSAADGQSGLAVDPSGTVAIDTSTPGPKSIVRAARDNVGHEAEASCTTDVVSGETIVGTVKGPLTVKAGQSVELAPGAHVTGAVKVKAGGALDVEGARLSGSLTANGAALVRLCAASVSGAVRISGTEGPVTIGESGGGCAPGDFSGPVTVKSSHGRVTIAGESLAAENVFHGALKVLGGSGGAEVVDNEVDGNLTVTGNQAPVLDTPNSVEGKAKLQ